jgi:acylglycerol lipase
MRHTRGTLNGARSLRLACAAWLPDDRPKASIVLVHGYGEHAGRYRHVIEALVARGYGVHALDHRGHGESEGARAHVERFGYTSRGQD